MGLGTVPMVCGRVYCFLDIIHKRGENGMEWIWICISGYGAGWELGVGGVLGEDGAGHGGNGG